MTLTASSSCEPLWDREAKYARMWIESQNPARMVVRVRHAIADPDGYIGHSNIPSGSPYGQGDWTDEWYYIYPDGTHTRHVRIYTGLAGQSLLVTDETFSGIPPVREIPPGVVHEFQEDFIFGLDGHLPDDDIDDSAITFIKTDGSAKRFTYDPYPKDYAEFTMANIKVIHTKSDYWPFTISIPYGLENQTYPPEDDLPYLFQTWGGGDGGGYSTSLGHSLNWWHFRRTNNILEQVYLSGMINPEGDNESMKTELLALERSWITFPRLMMEGLPNPYTAPVYSMEQRAYVIPGGHEGARKLEFELGFPDSEEEEPIAVSIVDPVFVVKNWGKQDVQVKVDNQQVGESDGLRVGYETTPSGTDLVIWLNYTSNQATKFSLEPIR